MIAIYCRVSSSSQRLASQTPDLKKWIEAYAGDHQVKWYRDKATGTNMDRPGWNRLQADIDAGKITTVVCWRIDRLGRTAAGLSTLFNDLQERKINLVSIKDALDLSTPAGRLMANVLASVAQFETEVRRERQLAGIERAKAEGKTWGGSEPGRRLKVKPEQIKTIKRMARDKESKAAMARATGLSRPTIYSVLATLHA